MEYFSIKNLDNYQHYKDRNIVWIKWHLSCYQDYNFNVLSPAEKWYFIGLIGLGCKCENKIPKDGEYLSRMLGGDSKTVLLAIEKLIDSNLLAKRYTNKIREDKSRSDKIRKEKKETDSVFSEKEFELVWEKYPKKLGKDDSLKYFKAQVKSDVDFQKMLVAVEKFTNHHKVKNTEMQYIPHGSTWFNNRWKDWVDYEEPKINQGNQPPTITAKDIIKKVVPPHLIKKQEVAV